MQKDSLISSTVFIDHQLRKAVSKAPQLQHLSEVSLRIAQYMVGLAESRELNSLITIRVRDMLRVINLNSGNTQLKTLDADLIAALPELALVGIKAELLDENKRLTYRFKPQFIQGLRIVASSSQQCPSRSGSTK